MSESSSVSDWTQGSWCSCLMTSHPQLASCSCCCCCYCSRVDACQTCHVHRDHRVASAHGRVNRAHRSTRCRHDHRALRCDDCRRALVRPSFPCFLVPLGRLPFPSVPFLPWRSALPCEGDPCALGGLHCSNL